jgi:hypothetical protein
MKDLILKCKQLSEHKFFELQISLTKLYLAPLYVVFKLFTDEYYFQISIQILFFDFDIIWSKKTDHAGFNLNFTIFWLFFSVSIYDCRHWNYETEKWYVYEKGDI